MEGVLIKRIFARDWWFTNVSLMDDPFKTDPFHYKSVSFADPFTADPFEVRN